MNHQVYSNLYVNESYSIFDFLSIGPRGVIPKRITFIPTEYEKVYNLVFGDISLNGEINDYNISNNGDRNKVLATVVHAIDTYLNFYPDRVIFFTGSTVERTRLYRMAIGLNLEYLSDKFYIHCQTDGGFQPFEKNVQATSFLVRRKA